MPIVSSSIAVQRDLGDEWFVVESHEDHVGIVRTWRYVPAKSVNLNAKLAEHAAALLEQLVDQEIDRCIRLNVLSTVYITKNELAARIRAIYRDGDPEKVMRVARWIRARIVAGDFTETQVRNAFGLTQNQWDALKIKLQNYDDALVVVETAKGE